VLARPVAILLAVLAYLAGPAHADRIMGARAPRAWLGVGIESGEVGVRITEVVEDTPAFEAGLLVGDEILSVDGRRVGIPRELQTLIGGKPPGHEVLLRVLRDDRKFRLRVALEALPDRNEILRRRLVGKRAPAFEVEILNGKVKGKLADLRGKVVLVEFWATWCTVCLSTHPALSKLAAERGKDGLVVLAISQESRRQLERFVGKEKPTFSVARDRDRSVTAAYYATVVPQLVVIDRRGVVRYAGVSEDPATSGLTARQAVEANVTAATFAAERALRATRTSRK
jgi:peroxiredoxin